ncbi:MAG: histidine kinase dimerization/phosphoacceptor domain -containing protein [Pseudomonadota bacterium]
MGEAQGKQGWFERLPLDETPLWRSLAIAGGIVAVAFVVRLGLRPALPVGSPFVTFFPAVLLIAFLLGARIGAAAALVSTFLGAIFFMADPLAPGYFATAVPSAVAYGILVSLNLALFHWMQRANAMLRVERGRSAALAATRGTLFRELQHRVSNNLQVAAGLLALQKKHVEGERARAALEEASRRIGVIGRISRQLYEHDGATRSIHALLAPLCADVVDAAGKHGVVLRVTGGETEALPPEAALPVALIVAEAVANAIEHGFSGREDGTIDVACARDGSGVLSVEIRDNGCGLPAGFDIEKRGSLGLRIAATLADQLGGRFELVAGEGAVARLVLPG